MYRSFTTCQSSQSAVDHNTEDSQTGYPQQNQNRADNGNQEEYGSYNQNQGSYASNDYEWGGDDDEDDGA